MPPSARIVPPNPSPLVPLSPLSSETNCKPATFIRYQKHCFRYIIRNQPYAIRYQAAQFRYARERIRNIIKQIRHVTSQNQDSNRNIFPNWNVTRVQSGFKEPKRSSKPMMNERKFLPNHMKI